MVPIYTVQTLKNIMETENQQKMFFWIVIAEYTAM